MLQANLVSAEVCVVIKPSAKTRSVGAFTGTSTARLATWRRHRDVSKEAQYDKGSYSNQERVERPALASQRPPASFDGSVSAHHRAERGRRKVGFHRRY